MANKSISQLTAGGAVSGTDLFPDVQTAGVGPVKVTATQLATFFWYQPTLVNPALGAATATSINIGGATLGSNVLAVNGSAIMTSLALGGATIGSNNLAVTGTTLLGGATTVSTGGLTIGVAGTTGGTIALKGSTAGTLTLQVPATVTDYSITLPSAVAAGNGYILTSTTGGVTSWTNPTSLGIDLDVGTTAITNGGSGRVLYQDGSNVLQENANFIFDGSNLIVGTTAAIGSSALTLSQPNAAGGGITINTPSFVDNNYKQLAFYAAGSNLTSYIREIQYSAGKSDLAFGTYPLGGPATERMRLDAAGNLGLGVTPSAWTTGKAFEVGNLGNALWGVGASNCVLTSNVYYNSSAYKYANTAPASQYQQYQGAHQWYTAASGTADAAISFTQAMTLDANGNLGIGTASPAYKLDVSNTGASTFIAVRSNTGYASFLSLAGNGTTPSTTSFDLIFDGTAYVYNRSSGAMVFGTNNSERARFAATTATLSIGTSAAANPGAIQLYGSTSGSSTITVAAVAGSSTWTLGDPGGNVNVGYLNIPQNAQTSAYVAVVGDVGKHISITTGGVTVNASVFSAGDVFTIYNDSGSSQNITAGAGVTFRLAGTATSGTPRTVAQYGLATVLCVTGGASPVFVLSGAGVA